MMLRSRFLIILPYLLLNSCRLSIGNSDQNADQNTIMIMTCKASLKACSCYNVDYIFGECNRMGVAELKMSDFYFELLPSNFFDNFTTLEYIKLENNHIRELPNRLFSKLNQLYYFDISSSSLETIPDDLFTNHSQIEEINLSNNQISSLLENCLSGARNLKILDLNNNLIQILPERIFHTLHKLEVLHLGANQLASISENQFVGTPNLTELDLSRGQAKTTYELILSLSDKCFQSLYNLHSIEMYSANLYSLPKNLFDNSTEIKFIHLGSNSLQTLPKGIFDYTRKLEWLDLSNNQLITLQPDIFQNTQELNWLVLNDNNFVSDVFLKSLIWKPMEYSKLSLKRNRLKIFDFDIIYRFQSIDLSDNHIDAFNFSKNIYDHNKYDYSISKITLNLTNNPLKCDCLHDKIDFLSKTVDIWVGEKNICTRDNHSFCPIPKDVETNCTFLVRHLDRMIKIDCSNAGVKEAHNLLKMPSKKLLDYFNISKCELEIQNNEIELLPTLNQSQFECVQSINARNNNIKSIQVENLSENLKLLDISYNKIKTLDGEIIERLRNLKDTRLILKGNNWDCGCDFRRFIRDNSERIDLKNITCSDGIPLNDKPNLCLWEILLILFVIFIALAFSVATTITYYKYQTEIRVWLYAHNLLPALFDDRSYDESKEYDAFISYSHLDEDFVVRLADELERNGPIKFKLCLHDRDWIIGDYILEQIARSVKQSRRTIVVLSTNFLQSPWALLEFRTAHKQALKERRVGVIIIIYGNIDNINELDADLRAYLRTNTYIKWNENGSDWFFDKLRYSLPHPPKNAQNSEAHQETKL